MKKLLIILIFIITIQVKGQAAFSSQTQLPITSGSATQPALSLTWDDDSVDEWYSIKDTLRYYGVKCTFFVCRFSQLSKEKIEKLKVLLKEGHEIGCHSFSHADAEKFINNYGIDRYIHDEIVAAIDSMNKYGLHPVSFAYPQGIRNSSLDKELEKYFTILRGTTYYPMPDFRTPPMVNGLGIDENYSPVDFLLNELEKDYSKGKFIVLYGHTPVFSYEDIPKYHTSVRRLVQIIKKARQLGFNFVTISELNKDKSVLNGPFSKMESKKF